MKDEEKRVRTVLHPYVQYLLTKLRDRNTGRADFRQTMKALGTFMAYEVLAETKPERVKVVTPLGQEAEGTMLPVLEEAVLVSVLRASMPMLEGMLEVFRSSQVGFVVARRYEAEEGSVEDIDAQVHYVNLPDIEGRTVIVVDPMLATGSTLKKVLSKVLSFGRPSRILVVSAIATSYGISRVLGTVPDATLYVASIDEGLDQKGYILPGLGDAGDRAYS
ncbi:MAG: uracil phosphoribosyltransferase [Thermoprotei archaeon]|nr:uracil phosphoribosyltransferase [TACK group archaeon]